MDDDGKLLAHKRIGTGAEGFAALLELIASHGGSPQATPLALETDKNLLVAALTDAGFTVYAINPRAVARYRERHGQAGGKSDPGDALVLANILRTDRAMHRTLPQLSEQAHAIKRPWTVPDLVDSLILAAADSRRRKSLGDTPTLHSGI